MTRERAEGQLGFWTALALVVGNIIGAGIFCCRLLSPRWAERNLWLAADNRRGACASPW